MAELRALPSWGAVVREARPHASALAEIPVIEPLHVLSRICPSPLELQDNVDSFDASFEKIERVLAGEGAYRSVWVIPGLHPEGWPVELEDGVPLMPLSAEDLAYALNLGIVTTYRTDLVQYYERERGACVRYLTKGPGWEPEKHASISQALEELVALQFPSKVRVTGFFNVSQSRRLFGWGSESRVTGAGALDSFRHRLQPSKGEDLRALWNDFRKTQDACPKALSIAL